MIKANIILPFDGTHAGIPSGWIRETTLDGKYPKAWGSVAPNNIGGTNTHTHTSTAHTHTMSGHTHTYDLAYVTDESKASTDYTLRLVPAHLHTIATTSTTTGGSLVSQSVTWSSVNHEPPYYTVIFIKPSGGFAFLATGILAYFNLASNPSGWLYCNGSGGTSDLRSKYLKGASTGANAGTTGGATSHIHTISHTHTVNVHSHTGISSYCNEGETRRGDDAIDTSARQHTHVVYLANTTATINAYTNTSAGGDTIDLAYKKVGIFTYSGGGVSKGLIAMWLGASTSIPGGWNLCDGSNGTLDLRNKFIKTGSDITQNGAIGGTNTHTHSTIAHTHTATGTHNHSGSTSGASSCYRQGGYATQGCVPCGHTHTVQNISSTTALYVNSNINASSPNHEPTYRTVAYIQFIRNDSGMSQII